MGHYFPDTQYDIPRGREGVILFRGKILDRAEELYTLLGLQVRLIYK